MGPVRTRPLGASGLELTLIGFGAWEAGGDRWGPNPADRIVIDAMRAGFDAGIGWIDTAEVYGDGVSERLVGRALEGRRGEVRVATKVAPAPEGTGFRPEEVRKACEASLQRIGVERIDLYQLHWPDSTGVPVEDTFGGMAELQDAGLVRCIGVSNFDRELIERCERVRHVDSLQQEFSLLNPEHQELIAWCGEQGTGVLAYGPLAFGLLTGALTKERIQTLDDWRRRDPESVFAPGRLDRNLEVVDALRRVAEPLGITVGQLALAWNVAQVGVTSAIAGSRNPDHVRENAAAGDVELDDETLAEVDALMAAVGDDRPDDRVRP
jgi:aryl-alcohol dehydrogenase-like predicted oxidoreductase